MFENTLQRFRWRSLSVRNRIIVIIALILLAIAIWASLMFSSLNRVATGVRSGVNNTIEMTTQMSDVDDSLDRLLQIRTRLFEEFNQPAFNPAASTLHDDWHAETQLLEAILPGLEALALEQADEITQSTFNAEFRNFELILVDIEEEFDRAFDIVEELSTRQTGAFAELNRQSSALEVIILDSSDEELIRGLNDLQTLQGLIQLTGSTESLAELEEETGLLLSEYEQKIPRDQQSVDIAIVVDGYLSAANEVSRLLDDLDLAGQSLDVSLNFFRNTASRVENIVARETENRIVAIESLTTEPRQAMFLGLLGILGTVGLLLFFFERDLAVNLRGLLATSQEFESGNFAARAVVRGQDEFSQLAGSFNVLAVQL